MAAVLRGEGDVARVRLPRVSPDVAAPRVLHGGRQPQLAAQLQRLPRLGQAAELADLDVNHVRGAVLVTVLQL